MQRNGLNLLEKVDCCIHFPIQMNRDMATGEQQNQSKLASSRQPCAVALTLKEQTLIEYVAKDMILHYSSVGCVLQVAGCRLSMTA